MVAPRKYPAERADLHDVAGRPEHVLRAPGPPGVGAVAERRGDHVGDREGSCGELRGFRARKVHAELNLQGHPVALCTVQRLMRAAGLRGNTRAKGPRTTVPGKGRETHSDLVKRKLPRPARMSCGSRTSPTAAPSPGGSTRRSSPTCPVPTARVLSSADGQRCEYTFRVKFG
jgi:transposase InsO family protein